MCGIVCYTGKRDAVPILLDGLYRLEYRGYDSSGIAVLDHGPLQLVRSAGKIANLQSKLATASLKGQTGIGHTRWATHGKPTEANAHPHPDCTGDFVVVHNGIIENYSFLRKELQSRGHHFQSETDTEVIAHLLEENWKGDLGSAFRETISLLAGTFGLAILSRQAPETVMLARRGSPLLLGVGHGEMFAASDVSAILPYTNQVIYLEDNDLAELHPSSYEISSVKGVPIQRDQQTVEWDIAAAEKQGFAHFMLKEIFEEPEAAVNAMRGRLLEDEGTARLGGLDAVQEQLRGADHVIIVSCGTSYYAGLIGRYVLETTTEIAVEVDLASEFRYRKLNLKPGTMVLAISQSGETADTLAAVREAKQKGVTVLGLVNVVGSTIARETHAGIYNHAGPEIGVASTKAFVSQLTILYLLSLLLGRRRNISVTEGKEFIAALQSIPGKIGQILAQNDAIRQVAEKYASFKNFMFIGRKFNYPIALEGALKLKEISYLHAEGYAAGEMKHGPIALIDPQFPTVCIAPQGNSYEKIMSNLQEIRARSGPVLAIATEGDEEISGLANDVIYIPEIDELHSPLLTVIPLQLFAYHVANIRGCEIDKPRNLAKSVTVE
ncbi:MAG TPA: glutamine--fructose-6-phosphate transaminase (isomerizing) [Acidobacteriota bacterium]|jgi:glucosamine--fructose-6-phosphate aminotransferase (isomerizing)|nr:glutamine--fructose-6-phosphate transaminase (isomerizing) [Acidobacteriota bacterium]